MAKQAKAEQAVEVNPAITWSNKTAPATVTDHLGILIETRDASLGSLHAYIRKGAATATSRKLLAKGIMPYCLSSAQRDTKNPESRMFNQLRTICGNAERMTDPDTGKSPGTFKIDTKAGKKDKDGNLTLPPVLVLKQEKEPDDVKVTAEQALKAFNKWLERKSVPFLSGLAENGADALQSAVDTMLEAKVQAVILADAEKAEAGEDELDLEVAPGVEGVEAIEAVNG